MVAVVVDVLPMVIINITHKVELVVPVMDLQLVMETMREVT